MHAVQRVTAPLPARLQDMAAEDKERVKLEIAAMDPETLAAIQDAAAEARAAKKEKGTDKKVGRVLAGV